LIKLTEEEYNQIFEEGDQALLIAKIKEQREEGLETHSNLTSENTHFQRNNQEREFDSRRS